MDATHAISPATDYDNRRGLRAVETTQTEVKETKDDSQELSWLGRRLAELGIIKMAKAKPSGWNLNPSTITAYIVIISAILALFGAVSGVAYYQGYKDREMHEIRERVIKAEEDAKRAEKIQLLNDKSHEPVIVEKPSEKPTKEKK